MLKMNKEIKAVLYRKACGLSFEVLPPFSEKHVAAGWFRMIPIFG